MKKEKVDEIMDKVIAEWEKQIPEGAVLNKQQLDGMRIILLGSPHNDGCQRVKILLENGKSSTHLVPFEDMILKGLTGKQMTEYPQVINNG